MVEQLATGIVFPQAQPRGLEFAWITAAVPDPDVWLIPKQPPPHSAQRTETDVASAERPRQVIMCSAACRAVGSSGPTPASSISQRKHCAPAEQSCA